MKSVSQDCNPARILYLGGNQIICQKCFWNPYEQVPGAQKDLAVLIVKKMWEFAIIDNAHLLKSSFLYFST